MTGSSTVTTGLAGEFRLLGPVEARADGADVGLGGSKPTALLALLLLSANRPVSAGALIDGLWGEAPPRTAGKMIQVYVSRIRRQLGDAGGQLKTTTSGYQLQVEPEAVDLFRFEALRRRANAELATDPDAAAALLGEALALWRGPALANVRTEPFAEAAAVRLEELRLGALEERVDAQLAAGRHGATVADLQQLVATFPTRERFGEQLMLALYRCGRQAEALVTAQTIRTNLRESLGIDPGPRLAQLELAILRQDPELSLPPALVTESRATAVGDGLHPSASPGAPVARRRRPASRWWWFVAVAVAAAVALSVIFTLPGGGRHRGTLGGSVKVAPSSLLVIDGQNASLLADVRLGGQPDLVAVAAGLAWVTDDRQRTVSEVRLSDHATLSTFGLPANPSALATTGDDVWIGVGFTGTVSHLFASTSEVAAPFYPDGKHSGLVTLAGDSRHVYTGLPDGRLVALATDNLAVTAQTRLPDRVDTMAVSGSHLCAAMFRAPEVDCVRTPGLNVLASLRLPATPISVACDEQFVWALAGAPARVYRLDLASGGEVTRLAVPVGATQVVASRDYLWVVYGERGTLLRLPLASTAPAVTVDVGQPVGSITTWGDDVVASIP